MDEILAFATFAGGSALMFTLAMRHAPKMLTPAQHRPMTAFAGVVCIAFFASAIAVTASSSALAHRAFLGAMTVGLFLLYVFTLITFWFRNVLRQRIGNS